MTNVCASCGRVNEKGDKTCSKCGQYLQVGSVSGNVQAPVTSSPARKVPPNSNKKVFTVIAVGLFILSLLCVYGVIYFFNQNNICFNTFCPNYGSVDIELVDVLGFVAIVLWVIIGFEWNHGIKGECPSCKSWFSNSLLAKVEIDRQQGIEWQTRAETTYYDDGKTSTTYRDVPVNVTRVKYLNSYQCKNCGFQWKRISNAKL